MVSVSRGVADLALRRAGSRRRWMAGEWAGLVGAGIVVVACVLAIFAAQIARQSPDSQHLLQVLQGPSAQHPLGTDEVGRDVLSRVIYGSRIPLGVGSAAVVLGGAIGVALGMISGYVGRWVDAVLGRVADIQLSIPAIILAVAFLALRGGGLLSLVVVLAATGWPTYYRVVRSHVISARTGNFVTALSVIAASHWRIMFRHLIPDALPLVVVTATLDFSRAVLLEAGLSYLGLGVQPPTPDWGLMVASGQTQLAGAWWISVFPGIALVLLLLGINLFGDWLADRVGRRTRSGVLQ